MKTPVGSLLMFFFDHEGSLKTLQIQGNRLSPKEAAKEVEELRFELNKSGCNINLDDDLPL